MKIKLENEFVKLNYSQIEKIADLLKIQFAKPINSIPKQNIFATIKFDYSIEEIKKAIEKVS